MPSGNTFHSLALAVRVGMGLHVGALSLFWEPWVWYFTSAEQFYILFTETGLTMRAMKLPCKVQTSCLREIFLSWRLQPGVLPQSFLQQRYLLAVIHVPCRYTFCIFTSCISLGRGTIHICRPRSTPGFFTA